MPWFPHFDIFIDIQPVDVLVDAVLLIVVDVVGLMTCQLTMVVDVMLTG